MASTDRKRLDSKPRLVRLLVAGYRGPRSREGRTVRALAKAACIAEVDLGARCNLHRRRSNAMEVLPANRRAARRVVLAIISPADTPSEERAVGTISRLIAKRGGCMCRTTTSWKC